MDWRNLPVEITKRWQAIKTWSKNTYYSYWSWGIVYDNIFGCFS